jgi:hypothetical protein
MGVGGQRHALPALSPGMTRYHLYRRLGGSHGRYGRVRKISPPLGFDLRAIQPVASRYTDWAVPAHNKIYYCLKYATTATVHIVSYFHSIPDKLFSLLDAVASAG